MRRSTSYRLMCIGCVFCILVNLLVSAIIFIKIRKPATYNIEINQPPDLSTLSFPSFTSLVSSTNQESSLSLDTNLTHSVLSRSSSSNSFKRCVAKYEYGFVGDSAVLNGRLVSVGSNTAFGVVAQIFPERILFDDGTFIENKRFASYDHDRTN